MIEKNIIDEMFLSMDKIIKCDESGFYIIDKIDEKYISAHYAQTHLSVALLINGVINGDVNSLKKSEGLMKHYLNDYKRISLSNEFHHDFNNFAVSLYYTIALEKEVVPRELLLELKSNILDSKDSNHYTINWLPMRIFNLLTRNTINPSKLNEFKIKRLFNIIKKATYEDFVFDDRVPRGKSFNLQYNISTIAGLLLIKKYYKIHIEIDVYVDRLKDFIDPLGDINYMGRGTNQIFAWGPWFFIAEDKKSWIGSKKIHETKSFFINSYQNVRENGNLIMNNFESSKKDFWWDYHYSSVYQAHLLMWLMLSKYKVEEGTSVKDISSMSIIDKSRKNSGIIIYDEDDFFAFIFSGREEYLAERGPAIYNLWLKDIGTIFKGGFGPTPDHFGMNTTNISDILFNYLGPMSATYSGEISINYSSSKIEIVKERDSLNINFEVDSQKSTFFNMPFFRNLNHDWELSNCEGRVTRFNTTYGKNQYGELVILNSSSYNTKFWNLKIKLIKDDINADNLQ